MLKKLPLLSFILIALSTPCCFALDIFEKELLKKPHQTQKHDPVQNEKEQPKPDTKKSKIPPIPNYYFTDQNSADLYRDSLNGTNEQDLLEFFDSNDDLSKKTFKAPKSDEYLPPSTDDIRGFKIYKKPKKKINEIDPLKMPETKVTQPKKMFHSQDQEPVNKNCNTIQDINERQKCLTRPNPFMQK